MKNSTSILLAAILFIGCLFSTTSCKKDDIPDRDKFLGSFSVVETCGNGNDTYDLSIIESGSSENAVVIMNLYDWQESMSGTVNGNSITIPSQLSDGLTFSGNGTISGNTLTINFSVSNGTDSDNCNSVCNRR